MQFNLPIALCNFQGDPLSIHSYIHAGGVVTCEVETVKMSSAASAWASALSRLFQTELDLLDGGWRMEERRD